MKLPHRDEFTPRLLEDATQAIALYARLMGYRTTPLGGCKVLDIGAHHGTFALTALEEGAAHVVCVEAALDNYAGLLRNLHANEHPWWRAVPLYGAAWVGDHGLVTLRKASGGNSGQYSVAFDERMPAVSMVPTIGFTTLLESRAYDDERWDYVKIDVEGAEWAWLTGPAAALEATKHFRFLDIELHPLDNAEYFPKPAGPCLQITDVDQWFRAAGCKIFWHESMPTRLAIVT
jgi:FkbM family methyltransferase